ncbi:MAG: hypothetical protein OXU61_03510 [Gammaproteobacteria bacterium]|nr:hypothetical protein [Gammaproteobacteria bacterium]
MAVSPAPGERPLYYTRGCARNGYAAELRCLWRSGIRTRPLPSLRWSPADC